MNLGTFRYTLQKSKKADNSVGVSQASDISQYRQSTSEFEFLVNISIGSKVRQHVRVQVHNAGANGTGINFQCIINTTGCLGGFISGTEF